MDLETSGLVGDSKPEGEPETRITCIGIMGDRGIRQFAYPWASWNTDQVAAEGGLLRAFADSRALRLGETVLTYNGVTFDFPLLRERFEAHGIRESLDGIVHVDQFPFVERLNKYRMRKESAASKFADIYTPKTTEAAYFARAYMFRVVTPQIQAKMLAHNAMDLVTTWNFHHDMLAFPDYRGFFEETRASGAPPPPANPMTPAKEAVEAFL